MRRRDTRSIFAEITAALEDMHSLTVEGQAPDVSSDMVQALVALLRHGLHKVENLIAQLPRP